MDRHFATYADGTFVGRQRLLVYYSMMLILLVLTVLSLCGISVYFGQLFGWADRVYKLVGWALFGVFLCRRLSLNRVLGIQLGWETMCHVGWMLYMSCCHDAPDRLLLVGHTVVLLGCLLFAILAHFRVLIYVISGLSIATYTFCCVKVDGQELYEFYLNVILVFLGIVWMGVRLIRIFAQAADVNHLLNSARQESISLFEMDKAEIGGLMQLVGKKELSVGQTEKLIDLMSRSGKIWEDYIVRWYEQVQSYKDLMGRVFPMLSPGQREICHLIIQGHKLAEVCRILQKSESNVTAQRTYIRSKLGVQKGEVLREALLKRLFEYQKNEW